VWRNAGMRFLLAVTIPLTLAACGSAPKKAADGPLPTDIPQEVTCCIAVAGDGSASHDVVPVEQCPEANRNPVDACDIGPGDSEPE
jgi:hypothetical protein